MPDTIWLALFETGFSHQHPQCHYLDFLADVLLQVLFILTALRRPKSHSAWNSVSKLQIISSLGN